MTPTRKLSNFILSYAEGIDNFTEAPTAYCIWAAISAVGATMKKNVWKKRGVYTIYPNQYIILTGPPGIGKGEAIHPIYNIAKKLKIINPITDRVTAPKIIDRIHRGFGAGMPQNINGGISFNGDRSCVLFSTELQSLLTASDWMLQFLCDAWDRNEYEYDTKNSGTANITDMCTSLIGACVPDYIRKINKDSVASINGGFTARAVFVYAEQPSKRLPDPIPIEQSPAGRKLLEDLEHDFKEIANLKGEFSVSPEAQIIWKRFYLNVEVKDDDSDVVLHFKRRLPVHVIKLAMIFSAAHSNNMIIAKEDMLNAIRCLADVQSNLDKAFRGVGESHLSDATAKIQTFIEKKGITSRREILQTMHRHVTPEDLERILALLYSIDFFTYLDQGGKQYIKHSTKKPIIKNTTIGDMQKP